MGEIRWPYLSLRRDGGALCDLSVRSLYRRTAHPLALSPDALAHCVVCMYSWCKSATVRPENNQYSMPSFFGSHSTVTISPQVRNGQGKNHRNLLLLRVENHSRLRLPLGVSPRPPSLPSSPTTQNSDKTVFPFFPFPLLPPPLLLFENAGLLLV